MMKIYIQSKEIQRYSLILSKILGNPMWMTLFIWYASELTFKFHNLLFAAIYLLKKQEKSKSLEGFEKLGG